MRAARLLRHHPTSSSSSYVIILPKSDLYIQGRDKKLIAIGNKPVFLQSLIPTSEQQVSIPQASVADSINSSRLIRFLFQFIDFDL
jgi:hypothetical protein